MKKLVITMSAIAAVAIAHAASVTWDAGTFTELDACNGWYGTGSGTDMSVGCVKMLVWEYSATDWAALNGRYTDAANIFADYKSGALTGGFSEVADMLGAVAVTGASTWTEPNTVYAAVLFLHDETQVYTADSSDYYMGNYASAVATEAGGSAFNLGSNVNQGDTATTWTAVPEPTSGLLLLLGVAGLALRRRRA